MQKPPMSLLTLNMVCVMLVLSEKIQSWNTAARFSRLPIWDSVHAGLHWQEKKGDDFYAGYAEKTIATKYPNVTRQFFEKKNMDVNIVKIEGSVELAPLLGLAAAIVDIVETGSTLRENGVEVFEEVAPISARVIVNTVSMKLDQQTIETLIVNMERARKGEEVR